jgi:zinc transport system ATP-binding protein
VPNLLLLDEPFSGVDLAGRDLFYQTVSNLRSKFDLSILMVSHDLAAASAVADRLVFLDHKIVCLGPPAEVIARAEVRHAFSLDLPALNC